MLSIIAWLIVGALAGWIASMIMKTNGSQGLVMDIIVGIIGSFLGGWLVGLFTGNNPIDEAFDISTILTSILGACILLAIVKAVTGRRV